MRREEKVACSVVVSSSPAFLDRVFVAGVFVAASWLPSLLLCLGLFGNRKKISLLLLRWYLCSCVWCRCRCTSSAFARVCGWVGWWAGGGGRDWARRDLCLQWSGLLMWSFYNGIGEIGVSFSTSCWLLAWSRRWWCRRVLCRTKISTWTKSASTISWSVFGKVSQKSFFWPFCFHSFVLPPWSLNANPSISFLAKLLLA